MRDGNAWMDDVPKMREEIKFMRKEVKQSRSAQRVEREGRGQGVGVDCGG